MPGEAITIGPFVGGLNTFSDPTAVADNELVECLNFELDLDGSLVSRKPIVDTGVSFPLQATGNMQLLGYFYAAGGVPYLIGSDGLSKTYYFNGNAWVLITATFAASAMTQFNNKAWMTAPVGSANPGGSWDPSTGFVADANMPKGEVIVAYKYRLWVAAGRDSTTNGTRLFFSNVLGGTTPFWPVVTPFIDIGAGDGQNIVQVLVYYNSLMVFRTDSVYSYQYSSDPASGTSSLVLPGVGLASKDAIVNYESFLYFMYDDRAYEFRNASATQINIKVPFTAVIRSGIYMPFAVSIFNNRAIFSFYDTMYVFNLRTRTWTRWRTTAYGSIGKIVMSAALTTVPVAYMHSSKSVALGGTRVAKTLRMTDDITQDAESFQCIIQTKNYNYEASSSYKVLFYWGADAIFRGTIKAVATPITYNYAVTYGQLRATSTYGHMRLFTYGQPISGTLSVLTQRDTAGSGSMRKFVKFLKKMRFRQITYSLTFETDGSLSTAPVRLFTLMTYVKPKEKVSKAVT